ncbi:MAG: nucleotidyltransferase domain-containing protein [Thermaerobacterales bacterium]
MFEFDVAKITCIAREHGLDLVVAFGSRISGTARPESDIDLAVRFTSEPPEGQERSVIEAFVRLFRDSRVDLVVLNRADPLLAFRVARQGRLLYEEVQGTHHRFQVRSLQRHEDARKFYRATDAYLDGYLRRKGLLVREDRGSGHADD